MADQPAPSRAAAIDRELDDLYARVPDVGCKGLCADSCGPIGVGLREHVRMARAGVRLPSVEDQTIGYLTDPDGYHCSALRDGRCTVYQVRPMLCRLWGAADDLPCPHGCRPASGALLDRATAKTLLNAALTAGGLPEPPIRDRGKIR